MAKFRPLQHALANKFGGDPSVCDLPRVMRLPGFIHQKRAPFLSRIISLEQRPPYALNTIIETLELRAFAKPKKHRHPMPPAAW